MTRHILKSDSLGSVCLLAETGPAAVLRDTRGARYGAGWLARALAAHEAKILARLDPTPGLPTLISFDGTTLKRSFLPGEPMHAARPRSREYFHRALTLLRRLHRHGIAHNDLAKEANWLCAPGDQPAIVDFQIAWFSPRRGKLFRALAREDLRHLLKHKRTYLPDRLTARQRALLATPTVWARLWRALWKPPYHWVTRRLLGRPGRRGPAEDGRDVHDGRPRA
jgi:serine/threonine protein kinase